MRRLPRMSRTATPGRIGRIHKSGRDSEVRRLNSSGFVGFITLITIALAIAIISSSVVLSIANAMKCTEDLERSIIEVTVMPGDTLWGIAKAYSGPEADLRRVIDDIMRENNLSGSVVRPGQVLKFQVPVAYSSL